MTTRERIKERMVNDPEFRARRLFQQREAQRRYRESEKGRLTSKAQRERSSVKRAAWQRAYYLANKQRIALYHRLVWQPKNRQLVESSPQHFLRFLFCRCIKTAARAAGLPVRISPRYLLRLYREQEGFCALTGLPMLTRCNSPRAISVDRIDSSRGYVPGNVQLVLRFANLGKVHHPNSEIQSLIADIRAAGGQRSKVA